MPNVRANHTATLLPNGKVLVAGGWRALTSAELYDPATGRWSPTRRMTHARLFAGATILSSAELYVPDYPEAAPSLNILYHSNQILSFSWHGVGTLQQSDNLTDWQAARRQDNPQTILTSNAPMRFFRMNSTP